MLPPHMDRLHQSHASEDRQRAVLVTLLSFLSYGLMLGVGIVLGRALGAGDYGHYSTAVALASVITTGATLGLEKLALRELPACFEQGDWDRARGFLVFATVVVVVTSVLVGLLTMAILWCTRSWNYPEHYLMLMMLFLPVMTLFMFLLEVCTACERFVSSTIVYRVVVPCTLLIGALLLMHFSNKQSARDAVVLYGCVWVVGGALMLALALRGLPRQILGRRLVTDSRQWLGEGLGFVGYSLIMSLFASSPLLVLGLSHPNKSGVGVMSAVLQIGNLLLIVATATTRLYAPRMSRLLVEHDVPAQQRLLRRRALGMSMVCGAFMTLVVLFGKPILGLFGPEFERGASSLVVYSIGTSLNLIFAFAPWYLQFRKRHTLVLALTGVGTALTMGAMLFVPWPDMPAYERVVLWYSVGLILLFITLRMLAVLELRRARREMANASLAHAEA